MCFKCFIIHSLRGLDLKLYCITILRIVLYGKLIMCIITTDIVQIMPCVKGDRAKCQIEPAPEGWEQTVFVEG